MRAPASRAFARGESTLRRLFVSFPDGRLGTGLLLLRCAAGATLLAHAMSQLGAYRSASAGTWVVIAFSTIGGASLLTGFLTPVGCAVAAIASVAIGAGLLPQSYDGVIHDTFPVGFVGVVAVALVLTGPGAFSVDARLLGRREIVIPPTRRAGDV